MNCPATKTEGFCSTILQEKGSMGLGSSFPIFRVGERAKLYIQLQSPVIPVRMRSQVSSPNASSFMDLSFLVNGVTVWEKYTAILFFRIKQLANVSVTALLILRMRTMHSELLRV